MKILVRLMVLAAAISGCATYEQRVAEYKRAQREEQARAKALDEYLSPEGFQAAKWGMSREDVVKATGALRAPNSLRALLGRVVVGGRPAVAAYFFARDRLARVWVFPEGVSNVRAEYSALQAGLTEKYGTARETEDTAKSADWAAAFGAMAVTMAQSNTFSYGREPKSAGEYARYESELASSRDNAAALSTRADAALSRYSLRSVWETDESEIQLVGLSGNETLVQIRYTSTRLRGRFEADELRQTADDL